LSFVHVVPAVNANVQHHAANEREET